MPFFFFNSSEEPDIIPQEEILARMDPREMARLARVRNIGIAVCFFLLPSWCE